MLTHCLMSMCLLNLKRLCLSTHHDVLRHWSHSRSLTLMHFLMSMYLLNLKRLCLSTHLKICWHYLSRLHSLMWMHFLMLTRLLNLKRLYLMSHDVCAIIGVARSLMLTHCQMSMYLSILLMTYLRYWSHHTC